MAKTEVPTINISVDQVATSAVSQLIEACVRNHDYLPGEVIVALDHLASLQKPLGTLFVADSQAK